MLLNMEGFILLHKNDVKTGILACFWFVRENIIRINTTLTYIMLTYDPI